MPIEGLTNKVHWYPRLGKIRLGIKKQGQKGPYPSATNYFVCPEEVQEIYGEKPTELDIMFPSEKIELIAPAWYKCYSYSQGKICQGNGRTCDRKVDTDTGDFANRETKHFEWMEAVCDPPHCPMTGAKQCRQMMSLLFLLPKVPGIGIFQLDTSSYYSIRNIYSMLDSDPEHEGFIRLFTRGRISSLPLKLSLVAQEVNPIETGRKTVYVLNVTSDLVLADQIAYSLKSAAQVLLPTLDDAEPPDDLYPEEVLQDAEQSAPQSASQNEACDAESDTHQSAHAAATTDDQEFEKLGRTPEEITRFEAERKERQNSGRRSRGAQQAVTKPVQPEQPPAPVSSIRPREEWDKITPEQVPGYLELEFIYCRLTGKSNRELYVELGGGTRIEQTAPAWESFLAIRDNYFPREAQNAG